MLSTRFDFIFDREILDERNIGYQCTACDTAFEQVVTQYRILLHLVVEKLTEGIDMIETLAGETALSSQILIDVGYRENVRIETAVLRKYALEYRRFLTCGE